MNGNKFLESIDALLEPSYTQSEEEQKEEDFFEAYLGLPQVERVEAYNEFTQSELPENYIAFLANKLSDRVITSERSSILKQFNLTYEEYKIILEKALTRIPKSFHIESVSGMNSINLWLEMDLEDFDIDDLSEEGIEFAMYISEISGNPIILESEPAILRPLQNKILAESINYSPNFYEYQPHDLN